MTTAQGQPEQRGWGLLARGWAGARMGMEQCGGDSSLMGPCRSRDGAVQSIWHCVGAQVLVNFNFRTVETRSPKRRQGTRSLRSSQTHLSP